MELYTAVVAFYLYTHFKGKSEQLAVCSLFTKQSLNDGRRQRFFQLNVYQMIKKVSSLTSCSQHTEQNGNTCKIMRVQPVLNLFQTLQDFHISINGLLIVEP